MGRSQVARSIATNDSLKYLRAYDPGAEYAPVTGFYSLVYGATGLERTENDVLAGSDPRFFVDRVQQLFAGTKRAHKLQLRAVLEKIVAAAKAVCYR